MNLDKKKIIIALCSLILVMAIGYAAFSTNLNINGSASISSDWLIEFTKIEEVSATSGVTILGAPTANGTSATFNVNLKSPGDKIVYDITVENKGTLDAVVSKINATETGSDAFYFNITGIKTGQIVKASAEKIITVEIGFDDNIKEQPNDPKNVLNLSIEFVQNLDQSITEEDIEITGPTLTNLSGDNGLTLENSAGRKLVNYHIYGNSIQNGTPTVDTPIEIQSVGDMVTDESDVNYGKYVIPIRVDGKNLFDINNPHLYSNYGITVEQLETGFNYIANNTGAWTNYINYELDFSKIAGKTITLSADVELSEGNVGMFRIGYWNQSNTFSALKLVDVNKNGNNSITVDIPESLPTNAKSSYCIFFNVTTKDNMQGSAMKLTDMQVEIGNSATEYEQYKESSLTNIYLNEPLRKVGNYVDYIDFEKGVVVRQTKYTKFIGDNDENWYTNNNNLTNTYRVYIELNDTVLGSSGIPILCSRFTAILSGTSTDDTENIQIASKKLFVRVLKNRLQFQSSTGFKTWVSSNNFEIVYPLAEEDATEKITFPNIGTILGDSIITIDTNVKPSSIVVDYYKTN